MMLYALICVCMIAEPICDAEHAIWAEQSDPIFSSEDECQHTAVLRVAHARIPKLEENTRYQIEVTCTPVRDPA
jgi:hypothetical protein